jgi:hypothetical protein
MNNRKLQTRLIVFSIIFMGLVVMTEPRRDAWFWATLVWLWLAIPTLGFLLYYKPNHEHDEYE